MRAPLVPLALWPLPLLLAAPAAGQRFLEVDEALRLAFPEADEIERVRVVPTREQREELVARGVARPARILAVHEARRDGELLGRAIVDDVMGKSRPITYMLAVDAGHRVTRVELLVYRESHGGEIRHETWRRQFVGHRPGEPLRHDREVRNIAGATISCRAVTAGVGRLLDHLDILFPAVSRRPTPAVPEAGGRTTEAAGEHRDVPPSGMVQVQRQQLLMGTTLELRLHGPDAGKLQGAADAAFAEVARLENVLSSWRDDSELSCLVARAGQGPQAVGPDLFGFLQLAREWHDRTDGALDVGVGAVVALWREAGETGCPPRPEALAAARARPGAATMELDAMARTATLRPGTRLDAGAFGKGLALDHAVAKLRARGVCSGLLNFGGQVVVFGMPPAAGWPVDLHTGEPAGSRPALDLSTGSLATTADTERGLVIEGRRMSHVVDPRTGAPVARPPRAVTVHAATATDADAWSTALFVLGTDAALARAEREGLAVRVVAADGSVHTSPAWDALAGSGRR